MWISKFDKPQGSKSLEAQALFTQEQAQMQTDSLRKEETEMHSSNVLLLHTGCSVKHLAFMA